MAAKPHWEVLGEEFAGHYYHTFDTNKDALFRLYHSSAMMTFEGQKACGQEEIKTLISTKMTFAKIQHQVTKLDCQPIGDGGVMVLVTGRLKTDDDPPHAYSQMLCIGQVDGSYFLTQDIFRLSIHDTL